MKRRKCLVRTDRWHRWWAWYPVWVYTHYSAGTDALYHCGMWVWFDYVWRIEHDTWAGSYWEYAMQGPAQEDWDR